MARTPGAYLLTSVAKLPNVTVAFPGEHWSNRVASGSVTPGEAVVPIASGGKMYMRTATAGDSAFATLGASRLAIALKTVQVPDTNPGSIYNEALGPNEIVNRTIVNGEYVHAYYSGAFHLTLVAPDTSYAPGDLIGWAAAGARPTGKAGTGSWAKNASADLQSVFEVMEWRPYSANLQEGILTVRSLRGQF